MAAGQPLAFEALQLFADGLNRPQFWWQLCVVFVAWVAAAVGSRMIHLRADARMAGASDKLQFSIEGLHRLAFPLVLTAGLYAGLWVLRAAHIDDERLVRLSLLLSIAWVGIRFGIYVLRRALPSNAWLEASERTLAAVIWLGVALHATGLLVDGVDMLEAIVLPLGAQRVSAWTIIKALTFIAGTVLVALWIGSTVEARLLRLAHIQANVRQVLARLFKAGLLVVAVLIALSAVGIDLTVLSVFGGALGVGLGLGLQRIASNYVSGFIILLDRSLRIGDMITVDQYTGVVTQINTRYTVLRALTGTETIVPNEMLVSSAVQNRSYSDRLVMLSLPVTVSYDADVDQAMDALRRAAQASQRVLKEPAAVSYITGFGADGVDLQVLFWISDPENGSMSVTSEVARGVYANLKAAGIGIPYPQRELRWASGNLPPQAASPKSVAPKV
ncbi:MAG TPA: mechanosensitive ion channel [Burkholderiaceae bacterium]|nr:mechanosensitive ion channel [Burkholderiaceae bacterium]